MQVNVHLYFANIIFVSHLDLILFECEIKYNDDCEEFRFISKTSFILYNNLVCDYIVLVNITLIKRE